MEIRSSQHASTAHTYLLRQMMRAELDGSLVFDLGLLLNQSGCEVWGADAEASATLSAVCVFFFLVMLEG
jgi:hypothetical protein